jgi:hypothetical protein
MMIYEGLKVNSSKGHCRGPTELLYHNLHEDTEQKHDDISEDSVCLTRLEQNT